MVAMMEIRVRADDDSAVDVKMWMSLVDASRVEGAMSSASSSGADSSFATKSFFESIGSGIFVEGGCAGSCFADVDAVIVLLECEYLRNNCLGLRRISRNVGFKRNR